MAVVASSAKVSLLAAVAFLCEVTEVASGGLRGARRAEAGTWEDFQAFDAASSAVDEQGWNAFLSAATSSARSQRDSERQSRLDAELQDSRALEVSISDDFAAKVSEQEGTPSLRDLAKEHWDGIRAAQHEETNQHVQGSLRDLLKSAGKAA
mmetsp:Transcript_29478/g.84387  ORF Transcript_29478/g.84387 Transcript_29478/m.84387 type:complete len:152 (-) Transcript_29478:61-516(-)